MDGIEHLAQEGLAFCLYCGGELAPGLSTETAHGVCFGCGVHWDRVFTNACPGCADGWVHLHYPDEALYDEDTGRGVYATGYGWCDCCHAHVYYYWWVFGTEPPAGFTIGPTNAATDSVSDLIRLGREGLIRHGEADQMVKAGA